MVPEPEHPRDRRPIASVVVPAHDEQGRIGATLRTLVAGAEPGEFDIVVVCNGCTDGTAAEARQVPGVRVVEIATASKIAALREGDRQSNVFPRIHLDGDVQLSAAATRAMAVALDDDGKLVAGVPGRYRLDEVSPLVRLFYEFRQSLPVFADGIIGAGVYAMSEQGRQRFGEWPEVMGDDQYVYRLFWPEERACLREHHTLVKPLPDLRAVIRRGVRVRQGNDQVTMGAHDAGLLPAPAAGLVPAVRTSLHTVRGVASSVVFAAVMVAIRIRSRFGSVGDWTVSPPARP
jgi:glycosyltransferase involved in cell wall biosynthesis